MIGMMIGRQPLEFALIVAGAVVAGAVLMLLVLWIFRRSIFGPTMVKEEITATKRAETGLSVANGRIGELTADLAKSRADRQADAIIVAEGIAMIEARFNDVDTLVD